jgi:hypothetical protein
MEYLIVMLMSHPVGDFLFQTSEMASEKNKRGLKGWLYALYHAGVYAIFITAPLLILFPEFRSHLLASGLFFLFTWLTHATIDHYSLGKNWSKMMGSDTLPDFTLEENNNTYSTRTVLDMYKAGFTSYVYIQVDNTLHLVLQAVYLIILGNYIS